MAPHFGKCSKVCHRKRLKHDRLEGGGWQSKSQETVIMVLVLQEALGFEVLSLGFELILQETPGFDFFVTSFEFLSSKLLHFINKQ